MGSQDASVYLQSSDLIYCTLYEYYDTLESFLVLPYKTSIPDNKLEYLAAFPPGLTFVGKW